MGKAKAPIASQVAEVRRELALRANTYPRLIAAGKMRQAEADLCKARMEAVLATLMFCQEHEAAIRAYMAERRDSAGSAA
ncbi:hypothetical protein [Chelativorans alearense]|uniref:hypothetical protein n=1 Tax=Chelativorans alearense TaxID=2681495 RepID=UPI0013D103DB|nr:hypothetical protein [Chelativorans alearense]